MPRASESAMRWLSAALALSLLAACGQAPVRPRVEAPQQFPRGPVASTWRDQGAPSGAIDPCAPTRIHRDSDYTPGGL